MDFVLNDFIDPVNMNASGIVPAITIPDNTPRGWENQWAFDLAALLNQANTQNKPNKHGDALREFLSLYYVAQNDLKDSGNRWIIHNGATDTEKRQIQQVLFRGGNTNNNILIAFTHIGDNGFNKYLPIHQVLTQLDIGSSYVEPHKNHFHVYIKPPAPSVIQQAQHLLAKEQGGEDVVLSSASLDLSAGVDPLRVLGISSHSVYGKGNYTDYGKKPLVCSEVIGPNTKYNPGSLDSRNVFRPELDAIHFVLELTKEEKRMDAYLGGGDLEKYNKLLRSVQDKYNYLLENSHVSVFQPPKHGKLLPVQVSDDRVYKGYFYMAEQGYFGRDKIIFSVIFGNGETVILTNDVSVVDYPSVHRFNLDDPRASAPCSTTPSDYKEMRQRDFEDIKRRWEELNESQNENEQINSFADYFSDWNLGQPA